MILARPLLLFSVLSPLVAAAVASAVTPASPELRITGMTFVGSRGSEREVVLRAQRALFRPAERIADLEDVHAEVTHPGEGGGFTMSCDRAELNLESHDFIAEGNVRGETRSGQRYRAPWVRYEHETGVLYTDAPVRMEDVTGVFRGDGFRYHTRERRFQLLGDVQVEQIP
jgi:LPS export ABC transporter protein LptC